MYNSAPGRIASVDDIYQQSHQQLQYGQSDQGSRQTPQTRHYQAATPSSVHFTYQQEQQKQPRMVQVSPTYKSYFSSNNHHHQRQQQQRHKLPASVQLTQNRIHQVSAQIRKDLQCGPIVNQKVVVQTKDAIQQQKAHLVSASRKRQKQLANVNDAIVHKVIMETNKIGKVKLYRFLGLALIALSPAILVGLGSISDFVTSWFFQIKEGRIITHYWTNPQMKASGDIYLFSLKNAPQFIRGAKPHLEEIGPFSYNFGMKRQIIKYSKDGTKVIYTESYQAEHDPKRSLPLTTKLTTLNMPITAVAIGVRAILERYNMSLLSTIISNVVMSLFRMSGDTLIDRITAGEFFEGRQAKFLEYINFVAKPLRAFGVPIPNLKSIGIQNYSLGIVSAIKSIKLDPIVAYSRTENGHRMGDIIDNKRRKYQCKRSQTAEPVMLGNKPSPFVRFPLTPACSQITMLLNQTKCGILQRRFQYTIPTSMLDSSRRESQCFCRGRTRAQCDGWLPISDCEFNYPVGFSFPHFYGNTRRQSQVFGLKPDPRRHQIYVDMWPRIGFPLQVRARLQIVIEIKPFVGVPQLSRLPYVVLPIAWIYVDVGLPDSVWLTILLVMADAMLGYGNYILALASLFGGILCLIKSYLNSRGLTFKQAKAMMMSPKLRPSSVGTLQDGHKKNKKLSLIYK